MVKEFRGAGKDGIFKIISASNHCDHERQAEDLYSTDPLAAELLLEQYPDLDQIWEPFCGLMHLADVFDREGKLAKASDILNRTNDPRIEIIDFLQINNGKGLLAQKECYDLNIASNPPYLWAQACIEKALEIVPNGRKVCMFLKLTFLEGKARKAFFKKYPPKEVLVCSSRIVCAMNGEFTYIDKNGKEKKISSAVCYAWFVWEKGFKGDPIIKWIN